MKLIHSLSALALACPSLTVHAQTAGARAVGLYFVVLVPFSLAWVSRFDDGPLAYVWRLLTYGQRSVGKVETALR